jgi:hypothetical protein
MRFVILSIIFIFLSFTVVSQTDQVFTGDTSEVKKQKKDKLKSNEWKKRVFFGGMVTPIFSNSAFYLAGNPHVGYRITDKFNAAAGGTGIYFSQRLGSNVYRQGIFGPFAYTRYFLTENFFGQVQYELLSQQNFNLSANQVERMWVPYAFFGGGYVQRFGDRSGIVFSILYNVYANQNSVYSNPLVQIGFNFGL